MARGTGRNITMNDVVRRPSVSTVTLYRPDGRSAAYGSCAYRLSPRLWKSWRKLFAKIKGGG